MSNEFNRARRLLTETILPDNVENELTQPEL